MSLWGRCVWWFRHLRSLVCIASTCQVPHFLIFTFIILYLSFFSNSFICFPFLYSDLTSDILITLKTLFLINLFLSFFLQLKTFIWHI